VLLATLTAKTDGIQIFTSGYINNHSPKSHLAAKSVAYIWKILLNQIKAEKWRILFSADGLA
jgi:hypothetical protein